MLTKTSERTRCLILQVWHELRCVFTLAQAGLPVLLKPLLAHAKIGVVVPSASLAANSQFETIAAKILESLPQDFRAAAERVPPQSSDAHHPDHGERRVLPRQDKAHHGKRESGHPEKFERDCQRLQCGYHESSKSQRAHTEVENRNYICPTRVAGAQRVCCSRRVEHFVRLAVGGFCRGGGCFSPGGGGAFLEH